MGRRNESCVYAIRCKENGKVYIGCSTDVGARFFMHMWELGRGCKARSNPEWQNDFHRFGEEAFEVYVLEDGVAQAARKDRENHWIDVYQSINPQCGYNRRRAKQRECPIVPGRPPIVVED